MIRTELRSSALRAKGLQRDELKTKASYAFMVRKASRKTKKRATRKKSYTTRKLNARACSAFVIVQESGESNELNAITLLHPKVIRARTKGYKVEGVTSSFAVASFNTLSISC